MNKIIDIRNYRLDADIVVLMTRFIRYVQKNSNKKLRLHDKNIILKMAEEAHSSEDETLLKLFNAIVAKLGISASMLEDCA